MAIKAIVLYKNRVLRRLCSSRRIGSWRIGGDLELGPNSGQKVLFQISCKMLEPTSAYFITMGADRIPERQGRCRLSEQ